MTAEEEEAKRLAELEAKNKKKMKSAGDKKDKKNPKGDDDDDEAVTSNVKIGNSEIIQKFDEQYEDYQHTWAFRDESTNFNQQMDYALTKDEMLPELKQEY